MKKLCIIFSRNVTTLSVIFGFFKYGPKWGLDTFNFNIWLGQWPTEGLMFSLLLYNANQVSMLCE